MSNGRFASGNFDGRERHCGLLQNIGRTCAICGREVLSKDDAISRGDL